MTRGDKNGTLLLLVERGNEINVEYSKKEIINKINSYFGYKLISEIRLQTFSLVKKKRKENFVLNKKSKKFKEKINEIKNQDIRNSLSQLLNIAKK